MPKSKKKNIKVRDLNPKKDAKGGKSNQSSFVTGGSSATGGSKAVAGSSVAGSSGHSVN